MSSVDALSDISSLATEQTNTKQTLNTDDFLKIMLTELTNQDPFEPMKNQDLINQIPTILLIYSFIMWA